MECGEEREGESFLCFYVLSGIPADSVALITVKAELLLSVHKLACQSLVETPSRCSWESKAARCSPSIEKGVPWKDKHSVLSLIWGLLVPNLQMRVYTLE